MTTIKTWLEAATGELREADIPTARLDAELILSHVLSKNRAWLVAHSNDELSPVADGAEATANSLIKRRINREPIAYLIGAKEFYGRNFTVTPDVLTPRPETEAVIELLKTCQDTHVAIDVGCGSGCIGITAALELPHLEVTLADISNTALTVAAKNADDLGAKVRIIETDLLSGLSPEDTYDIIIANLPYVDRSWSRSPETEHEPALALFADDGGLELIKRLLAQSSAHLNALGYVLLEADPEQHEEIVSYAQKHGLHKIEDREYALLLQRY